MGWFWPTSSCPEISGQPAQKKILQPGNFRPGLPPDAPETPQEGGDRLKIEPSNRSILKQPTERNFALSQIPSVWDFRQKRTALYKRGRNRILTNPTQAVILRIERALPVDGQPLRQITQRSNRTLWLEGRLLLFTLDEQAADTDDNQTQLQDL